MVRFAVEVFSGEVVVTRVAALVKQVPAFESMQLGPDGRLARDGVALEMNPYDRRAVAQAVSLVAAARDAGVAAAESVALTMGPPVAEDCLREAVACGVDRGVLLSDRAFAGSDTLATARALAALLAHTGPFDLVLVGKNAVDADTGQVGPELAELLGWTFAGPVRTLTVDAAARTFAAECETDDGHRHITGTLPAVLACAERLIAPAKAAPFERDEVDAGLLSTVGVADLAADGPWGQDGSPTWVGRTKLVEVGREPRVFDDGDVAAAARTIVGLLAETGVLGAIRSQAAALVADAGQAPAAPTAIAGGGEPGPGEVWAVVEPGRGRAAQELALEAQRLAGLRSCGARVVSLGALPGGLALPQLPVTVLDAPAGAADADLAAALVPLVAAARPWGLLGPSTTSGREILSRLAAALGLGLTGDAVELDIEDDRLVSWKPAFGGQLVAAITSTSDVQAVTIRPGLLAHDSSRLAAVDAASVRTVPVVASGAATVTDVVVDDDLELLAVAPAVIGVGAPVPPDAYDSLAPLQKLLSAELGATRKVTDKGWLPHSRQIGITGRAIAPTLFVSLASSGKFNHTVGIRAARCVLAVNRDARAPIFTHCDYGIVGDWAEAVAALTVELDRALNA